jgi:nucleoside-diphosphate-sugar epimerase
MASDISATLEGIGYQPEYDMQSALEDYANWRRILKIS